MRIHPGIGAALTLAALSLPLTGVAQKFQEPTKEELQMTSDPKAPGAAAVFLYRQRVNDNRNHYASLYARIKVLTEKGKEWATVEVPYVPGVMDPPFIEGRTIHADGTVIPLTGKATDLLAYKTNSNHVKIAVFNLPSVEVGSILEYKWSIPLTGGKVSGVKGVAEEDYYSAALAGSVPEWDVQQPIFVHKEHFYWNPFSDIEANALTVSGRSPISYYVDGELTHYLLFTQRLPAGSTTTRSPKDDFTLDIQDVPAYVHEADAPPEEALHYQVRFFRTPANSPEVYWDNEIKRWSKQLNEYAGQSSTIKDAASQITAGVDTAEAKARKLYDAVQALENTDFSRTLTEEERKQLHLKKELKNAKDVWNEKRGTGNDIAALYLALARAAGLNAEGLQVADRNKRIFDASYLTLHQFDSLLVVLHIDGKDIYLDPGEKLCPFGQLQWSHTLAGGIQESAKMPVYTPPNSVKDAITAHAADLTLDGQGGITGTVKILMNGPAALHWRQLNLTSGTEEVKKQLNESLSNLLPQGVSGEVNTIQGLETAAGYLSVSAKLSGQMGSATGKRLVLPGFFFSTNAHRQFVSEEKRSVAVDLHYAEQVIDDAVYHLPAGVTVESAPQPVQLPWPEHAALVVKTVPGAGTIDIRHTFASVIPLIDPKEYPALRDYYQKVAANDQQQLVLTKTAAGN
jgi:transglutaminase-like putative cysteine protease